LVEGSVRFGVSRVLWLECILIDEKPKRPDWMGDILDQLLAQILEDQSPAMTQVIAHAPRDADLATVNQAFEPCGHINPVTEQVALLDHNVTDIDADPEAHSARFRFTRIGTLKRCLDFDRAVNRLKNAGKLSEHAVAGRVRNSTSITRYQLIDKSPTNGQSYHRCFLVAVHKATVALDISGENCHQTPLERRSLHLQPL
jgi:hypothetical protein